MRVVNIHQAKTHLSKLVEEVEEGQEIIIARGGKPVARLVPQRKNRLVSTKKVSGLTFCHLPCVFCDNLLPNALEILWPFNGHTPTHVE